MCAMGTKGLLHTQREQLHNMNLYDTSRSTLDELFTLITQDPKFGEPRLSAVRVSLLESFLHYYELIRDQSAQDVKSFQEVASAQMHIAQIDQLVGSPDVAVWQYQKALDLYEALLARTPGITVYEDQLISILAGLGETIVSKNEQPGAAQGYLERAQSMLEARLATQNRPGTQRRELIRVLQALAEVERNQGNVEKAKKIWVRVIQLANDLDSDGTARNSDKISLATAKMALGRLLVSDSSTMAEGISTLRQAIQLRETITHEYPDRTDQVYLLGLELGELAGLYQSSNQIALAIETQNHSKALLEQLNGQFPNVPQYETCLYLALDQLSRLHNSHGEITLALKSSQQAQVILQRLVAQFPRNSAFQIDLARCYCFLGRLQQYQSDSAQALVSFQLAVDLLEGCPRLDAENYYELAINLAHCIALMRAKTETTVAEGEVRPRSSTDVRCEIYARRAVTALGEAFARGLTNLSTYEHDPGLDPLRQRPDFQKFLEELHTKPKPHNNK
jgi:tetratricopeptide (TPR) repeat protein